jgi:hypothetical protein
VTPSDSSVAHLQAQMQTLKEEWEAASKELIANPAVYQTHLQHVSLTQLDEVVDTLVDLFKRVKAPQGFAPLFHTARAVAATSLPSAIQWAQALRRAEYQHFPNFVLTLNQVASSLHTLLAFGDLGDTRHALASFGSEVAEGLALLGTAQRELAAKHEDLKKSDALVIALGTTVDEAAEAKKKAEDSAVAADAAETRADDLANSIQDMATEAKENSTEIETLKGYAAALKESLSEHERTFALLEKESLQQSKLIGDLLPKATSSGLASAFASRRKQLELIKWVWMAAFVASLALLVILGADATDDIRGLSSTDVILYLLRRLPIAGPLIWLAWFSAIQYGNSLRVQEDYAFKEATSKAFAGYRDHMTHLASIDLEEGNTAMTLMAQKTIEILAGEPLRIFGKTHKDASPATSVVDQVFGRKRKKVADTDEEE